MPTTGGIHLGFEVGSGEPVSIPMRHLAVVGQTQESGKTTTLEALVSRSAHTNASLAFVTKRGEQSFATGRAVQPYFRDRADWQFVTSIIDATLQEKNKFLRPWIMKICRTTRTLAEVQTKVREKLSTAKGINEGVYTQLDAYLELIVPEIRRARLAQSIDLAAGLNVMDVSGFATPMQMLFVQSALDWVNEHLGGTVVVIPEAWEFIPEGKGSPAKASAVTLVRKGAGIGNYIWVDSQDMAGVDKTILRGCAVWLIGVQREANEIKRNLANIPAGIKRPSASDVAQLERGQFYACWGSHAIKTYVQPAWMSEAEAQDHARGIAVPPSWRAVPLVRTPSQPTEDTAVNEREAQQLRSENEELRASVVEYAAQVTGLRRELDEALGRISGSNGPTRPGKEPATTRREGRDVRLTPMIGEAEVEELYQAIRTRLIESLPDDPIVLRIVAQRPEIRVEVERQVVNVDPKTLRGRMAMLVAEGFFDKVTAGNAAYAEMQRRAFATAKPNVYKALDQLAADGFLTKEDGGYQVVAGMKINIIER